MALVTISCLGFLGPLPAQAGSNRIVPGEGIGKIDLGRHGKADLAKLPKANIDDASMGGKHQAVWISPNRDDTMYIYWVTNSIRDIQPLDGATIELIRVTSPWFRTPEGISTGSRLDEILRRYPNAQPTETHENIYDDVEQGIAFEFAKEGMAPGPRCTAIMIHARGDKHAPLKSAEELSELISSYAD